MKKIRNMEIRRLVTEMYNKFFSAKNIITIVICFLFSMVLRLLFKYFDSKLLYIENDSVFCLFSILSICISSTIKKYFEIIDIPNIN